MSPRALSIFLVVLGALAWAALTACNQQTIRTPLRSFDRPSDVALTCVQYRPDEYDDQVARPRGTYEVRPLSDCEPTIATTLAINAPYALPTNFIPPIGSGAPFAPTLVAMVTQSARGELALVDAARSVLIDTDPYTPGYGFIPVGKLPEHVRSSKDGCWALTANSGSCDLSKIDVSAALHSSLLALLPQEAKQGNNIAASGSTPFPLTVPTKDPANPTRQLYARPAWIEMAPENDSGGLPSRHGYEDLDANGKATIHPGVCTGGDHRAWVALPGCQLVVKVHLEAVQDGSSQPPTGPTIEAALHVDQTGVTVVNDLTTLDCPIECPGAHGDMGAASDLGPLPGPSDGGVNLPTTQAWPAALAVDVESDASGAMRAGRLVIADGYGDRIDVVPFDVVSAKFGAPRSVTLDPGDNSLGQPGVRVVRASPRSEAGKFLYAVARDGTVRVIDLDRIVECETNPDPRWNGPGLNLQQTPSSNPPLPVTPQPQARALGCFPLGDPATPRRSPLAHSPGISLAPGQLPVDVAFVHVDAPPDDPTLQSLPPPASPGLLVGDFAWIISSDGRGSVVDIYDACPAPNQQPSGAKPPFATFACVPENVPQSLVDTVAQFGHPQPMLLDRVSHRLRSGHPRFQVSNNEGDNIGQPRVSDSQHPCAVAVPSTAPGIPDGGVPDAGACGSTVGNLPSLYVEPVPATLRPPAGSNEVRAIFFVDPDRVRTETWVLAWEGVLPGTSRPLGFPLVVSGVSATADGAYVTDNAGSWCGRGVKQGDKLVFTGCSADSECDQAAGFQCIRDPGAFADVSQGMCLPVDKTRTVDYWSQHCGKLLRSQRKYKILHARQQQPITDGTNTTTTDVLTLGEIYEPEFSEQTHTCGTQVDCSDVSVVAQLNGGTSPTACLPDSDGVSRCLLPCDGTDTVCGPDFECALSSFGDFRCMRAPIGAAGDPRNPNDPPRVDPLFWKLCMPEAQQYEVHAGDAFTISGTLSGFLSSESVGAKGECVIPPQTLESVRLSQWRVPLSAPPCPPNVDAQPLVESIDPGLQTNVCALSTTAPGVGLVHFENPVFNIAVQTPLDASRNKPIVPLDGTAISFNLTGGGGSSLVANLGVDVQAQQPRYALVGPDGQTVYVVDEGKSPAGAGLRGQLLRLFSTSQSVDTSFIVR